MDQKREERSPSLRIARVSFRFLESRQKSRCRVERQRQEAGQTPEARPTTKEEMSMTRKEAANRLIPLFGNSILIEYSYFSPLSRNQWFVGFRNDSGSPVVRGQGNQLTDAVEEAEQFYGLDRKRRG